MNIKKNKSLLEFNTFGVESTVAHYLKIATEEDLYDSIKYVEKNRLKYFFLGGGSNILLTSEKYNMAALHIQTSGIEIIDEDDESITIRCAAGENWDDVVAFSVERGLGGIENMSLIPGTIGAAPIQNIGAYGQELKDTFVEARVLLTDTKKTVDISNEECNFGYRDSIFKKELKDKAVILYVTLKLRKNPKLNYSYKGVREIIFVRGDEQVTVKEIRNAIIQLRTEKLPDPAILGNAGSFFKNPEVPQEVFLGLKERYPTIPGYHTGSGEVKIPAGWLIESNGWKGYREGNVGVHDRQALVIVNHGGATGDEVRGLASRIIESVEEKYGIRLHPEVNYIFGSVS